MSKTGHYKYINGELVKVSDKPRISKSVFFPKRSKQSCGAYVDEHLGHEPVVVKSKEHKRQIMRDQHLGEAG